jgi:NADH:ubiquinone oxidoreductase subunit F (NADH-binding)
MSDDRSPGNSDEGYPFHLSDPLLLADSGHGSFAAHVDRWGPLEVPIDLVAEVARAGLGEREGGGLSAASRIAAVRGAARGIRGHPVVVANGCESDSVGAGRRALLRHNPHLVLDGVAAACAAVRADRAILCIDEGQRGLEAWLRVAVDDRADRVAVEIVTVPPGPAARLEQALVGWLTHRKPMKATGRPTFSGVGGRPTLVEGAETLAGVAAVARWGATWWQHLGVGGESGMILLTVTGGVRHPGVMEVAAGSRLSTVLRAAGADPYAAVLVGGLSGTWLSAAQATDIRLSKQDLAPLGATIGNGVIAPMPVGVCPLAEIARAVRGLACGVDDTPHSASHNRLASLADAWELLAGGDRSGRGGYDILRYARAAAGDGLVSFPAAVVSFVSSAFETFAEHLAVHQENGRCPDPPCRQILRRPPLSRTPFPQQSSSSA